MKISLKKKIAAAAAAATILGGGGAAFAYWTTTGSGAGSGTVAPSNGTLTLHGAVAPGIYPGGNREVTFTADNDYDTDLRVGTIHSVVSTTPSSCLAGDFSIGDLVSNTTVPAHTAGVPVGTGSLVFANSAANQDNCKDASITLTLSTL